MRPRFLIIGLGSLLALGLLAVGGLQLTGSDPIGQLRELGTLDELRQDVVASEDPATARPLPEFTAELDGGGTISSSEMELPAVLHVYASWCTICQAEAPGIARLIDAHPDVPVYAIAVEDSPQAAAAFAESFGWQLEALLLDPDRSVPEAFGLFGQPHTIFADGDGQVRIHQGGGSFDEFTGIVAGLA